MKTRKKLTISLLLVALLFGMISTLAYLTKETDVHKNVFTVGKIEAELTEPGWDKAAKDAWKALAATNDDDAWDALGEAGQKAVIETYTPQIVPGVQFDKDPTLTIVAESVDNYAYVAVRSFFVVKHSYSGDALLEAAYYDGIYYDEIDITNDWEEVDTKTDTITVGNEDRYYIQTIYRVKTTDDDIIKQNDNPLDYTLFEKVNLGNLLTSTQISDFPDDAGIYVAGFVHQADGLTKTAVDDFAKTHFNNDLNW